MMVLSLADDAVAFVRRLWRHPKHGILSIVALAIGIGGVIGMFEIAHGLLRKKLPYADPASLAVAGHASSARIYDTETFRPTPLLDTLFDSASMYHLETANLHLGSASQRILVASVTPDFFGVLGVRMALGRDFSRDDHPANLVPAAPMPAVISHRLWNERFGRGEGVLGRSISLDIPPWRFSVAGVASPDVSFPPGVDAWIPEYRHTVLAIQKAGQAPFRAGVIGRLRPGVSAKEVERRVRSWQGLPRTASGLERSAMRVVPLREFLEGDAYRLSPLLLLATLVFLVFIIAAAVSILQVDLEARGQELAGRRMVGATAGRLFQLLTVESAIQVFLALVVGLAVRGTLVHAAATRLTLQPESRPGMSGLAWALTAGTAIVALAVVGLTHARTPGVIAFHPTRRPPLPLHIVSAAVIAVASILVGHNAYEMIRVDSGVEPRDAFVFAVGLNLDREVSGGESAPIESHFAAILQRVQEIPGASHAGIISVAPYRDLTGFSSSAYHSGMDGRPAGTTEIKGVVARSMTPGAISALGLRLIHGRNFGESGADSHGVIVNGTLAGRIGAGPAALGQLVRFINPAFRPYEIIGVVDDVRERDLSSAIVPTIYFSFSEFPRSDVDIVVRTVRRVPPEDVQRAVRAAVRSIAPHATLSQFARLTDMVQSATRLRRYSAYYLLALACVAVFLAGMCGASAATGEIRRRRREIAVRLALGATPLEVVRLVAWRRAAPTLIAALLGAVLAYWFARLVGHALAEAVAPSVTLCLAGALALFAWLSLATNCAIWRAVHRGPGGMSTRSS